MIRKIVKGITSYMGIKELIICFFLSGLLILLSFGYRVKVSTVEITDRWGGSHEIFVLYYGFPFETIGILNPTGIPEYVIITIPHLPVLWDGLFLKFALYFLLAFIILYVFIRLRY